VSYTSLQLHFARKEIHEENKCLASRGNPKATEKDKGISGQRRNNSNKEERKTERRCIEEKNKIQRLNE
jgi:hypothetical protein